MPDPVSHWRAIAVITPYGLSKLFGKAGARCSTWNCPVTVPVCQLLLKILFSTTWKLSVTNSTCYPRRGGKSLWQKIKKVMGCMERRTKLSMIAGAAFWSAVIAAPASYAQSFTGELDGTSYDFSIVGPGSFESLQGTLEATPWWGNATLAESAANLVGDEFGLVNGGGEFGPHFAYGIVDGEFPSFVSYAYLPWESGASATGASTQINHTQFATATVTPVAVPEINGNALALIGFILGVLALHIGNRRRQFAQGATFA